MKKESIAKYAVAFCSLLTVLAVFSITLYMIINGMPAFFKVGIRGILLETQWKPTAEQPMFGILYIVLTSVMGTAAAVLLGVPVGVLTAVFLVETAPKKLAAVVKPAVELLAGIPSVIYGLLGLMILNPLMYRLERKIFADSESHQFTGGANFLSAILVLAVMILPTVINISASALRALAPRLKEASLALGATRIQTVFKVLLPAAKSGIMTAAVLGVGRAVGEAMAISLVSGSSVNLPLPFHSVRFLTTAIVSEMGYANGLHRQVLFGIGLILFLFIMGVNYLLSRLVKEKEKEERGESSGRQRAARRSKAEKAPVRGAEKKAVAEKTPVRGAEKKAAAEKIPVRGAEKKAERGFQGR